MNRARRLLLRDPLLVAAFAALWACALVPLWWPRFLPLLDLPNHLDAIAIWNRFHDPSWGDARFFRLNLLPLPYWGYFLPVHLMSYVVTLEIANKIFLSIYALAFPVGAALFARQMGRSPWLALLAFPLVFNLTFAYGFITFCAGFALMLYAFWALERYLERPTVGREIALGVLALALYFTHVLPWLFFGLCAGILLFCHGWHPKRMARAALAMLPSVAFALYGFHASANGSTDVAPGPLKFKAKFEAVSLALKELPSRIVAYWPGSQVAEMLLLLGALWLALVMTARSERRQDSERASYRLELLVGLAGLCAFLLPAHLLKPVDLWMIGNRFVPVTVLFVVLLPVGRFDGFRKWIFAPIFIVCAAYPIALGAHWHRFDERAAAFRRIVRNVPRGKNTLTLVFGDGSDPDVQEDTLPYLMFPSYTHYFVGGDSPWPLSTGFPMRVIKDKRLPTPRWKHPHTFSPQIECYYWDYLLTKGEDNAYSLFGPDAAGQIPLIASEGDWRLYRLKPLDAGN